MTYAIQLRRMMVIALGVVLIAAGHAQQKPSGSHAATKATSKGAEISFKPGLEPRAIEILKTASARLAAAQTMSFTAVVSYESPSRLGLPLVYSTRSEVVMRRPNGLRVVTSGDGPPSNFYYDGKTMTAFAPEEKLVAIADAPPTLDAALQAAFQSAAIYFPFSDVIVADPYKDIGDSLTTAFYIGQSKVVGGTTTDMVAYVAGDVFIQIWIGAEDKLPRRIYAIYLNDRARLRHVLELSDWQLDQPVAADAFSPPDMTSAAHIAFARPDATDAPGMVPPPRYQAHQAQ